MGRKKGNHNKSKEVKQPAIAQNSLYSVSLSVNGQELKSEEETLLEAIKKMWPGVYKTVGKLKITKGKKVVERLLSIPQMKRLFGNSGSFTRQVAMESTAKYLDNLLK